MCAKRCPLPGNVVSSLNSLGTRTTTTTINGGMDGYFGPVDYCNRQSVQWSVGSQSGKEGDEKTISSLSKGVIIDWLPVATNSCESQVCRHKTIFNKTTKKEEEDRVPNERIVSNSTDSCRFFTSEQKLVSCREDQTCGWVDPTLLQWQSCWKSCRQNVA